MTPKLNMVIWCRWSARLSEEQKDSVQFRGAGHIPGIGAYRCILVLETRGSWCKSSIPDLW